MPTFDFSKIPGHVEHDPEYASDNLASASYKAASRLLTIKFRSGRSYLYGPVSFREVAALKQADRDGHGNDYFRTHIKARLIRETTQEEQ
jgi:KTSC domain